MKFIFQSIFIFSFYLFGILNALQIHDSVSVTSADNSISNNEVFDFGSEYETSYESTSPTSTKSVDTETEKSPVKTKTTQELGKSKKSELEAFASADSSDDMKADIYETESTTSTQDFDINQNIDQQDTSKTGQTTTDKTNTKSNPMTKVTKVQQDTFKSVDGFETDKFTNQDTNEITDSGFKKNSKTHSTDQTPVEAEASTTKHISFDGEGFLKAVSKLVNIRKRVGTGNTSVNTTKDYQKGVTSNTLTDSTRKPSDEHDNQNNDDDDDDQDQESIFDKYGIPEYVFWIIVYTVPVLIVLLLCLASYCCCCRR